MRHEIRTIQLQPEMMPAGPCSEQQYFSGFGSQLLAAHGFVAYGLDNLIGNSGSKPVRGAMHFEKLTARCTLWYQVRDR
jgi:hypothetical protein